MAGTSLFPEPYREPERDPVQLQQGATLIEYFKRQIPGQWTDNRLEQSTHYTNMAYIAIDRRRSEMSSVAACVERRKRRDRTTFGAGATSFVKALAPNGGQGNDQDYVPIHDHPLSQLVQYPNGPDGPDTFGSLLSYMDLQRNLTGSALVWFVPSRADEAKPCQMYPLHTALTTPQGQGSPQYPEGYWQVTPYYASGTMWAYGGLSNRLALNTRLPGREVGALRNPHPLTRTDGYAAFSACGVWMDILEQIDLARHSHMLQGQVTGTLVYIPGAGQDTLDRAKEEYKQRFAGARNARSINFLSAPDGTPGGQFKVEQASPSALELDFNESWIQVAKMLCAIFRVPPGVAGLDDSDNYAKSYAQRQQFHDDLLHDVSTYAQFFTQRLCRPWEKRPGEFRIKLQLPRIINKERAEPSVQDLISADAILVNELRARDDMPPINGGDMPPKAYSAWVMNMVAPPPAPAPMPDEMGGAPLPDGEGAEDQPTDDQSDETQNAVTAAALETLVVPQDDQQQDDSVQKAVRQKRQEGQVWTGNDGLKYTKRNGKIVLAPHPAGADGRYPSRHDGITYANEGDRDSDDRHVARERRGAQKQLDKVRAALTDAMKRHDAKQSHIEQLRQQLDAATKRSNRAQAKLGRPEANAAAQPVSPPAIANHDRLASALLNGQPAVRLFTAGNGPVQGHTIRDGASLQRFIAAGGVLPDVVYQRAAQKVQARTPQAQQTLSTADQWAATQANRHADRVAQHFGITRERAHALLVSAIRATAAHAAKNGGSMPNVTIRDKRTGKTAKLSAKPKGPTSGAPPKPSNPAGKGSLPERPQSARVKKGVRPEFAALVAKLTQKG